MALSKKIILTVSGHTIRLSTPINLFQNDQIYLMFEINEYGIDVKNGTSDKKTIMPINPLEATLYIETPLGLDNVESASIIDNNIVFHIESKYTQFIGTSKMQIKLTDKDCCQITLPHFEFEIKENIYDNIPLLKNVLLADEDGSLVIDENNNVLNVGTEIYAKPVDNALTIEDITTRQIQDFNLDNNVTGEEDILIQDNGVTKRVKASKLIKDTVAIENGFFYTKDEIDEEIIFDTDTLTPISLGGINAGTDLNNLSLQEIITKLLFPYVAPNISASLSYDPTGTIFEYGNSVMINSIKGNVIKKSDEIINISFLDSSTVLQEFTDDIGNGGNYSFIFSTPIIITSNLSSNRFRMKVVDKSNNIYYANTNNINFYYPYYFGVVNEDYELTNDLFLTFTKKVEAKGTKNNNYTTNNQRMVIAYPKSYGELKKILDANSFDVTNTFIKNEFNIIGLDNTDQSYYVYINNASSVTNFKMTFQY